MGEGNEIGRTEEGEDQWRMERINGESLSANGEIPKRSIVEIDNASKKNKLTRSSSIVESVPLMRDQNDDEMTVAARFVPSSDDGELKMFKPLDDDTEEYSGIAYSLPLNQMVKDSQEAEGKT
ncbi:hypothetical protein TorRG33x02_050860 [Trema orientale]|uniref:Uncharacterized protein n=1 Tax=Trema orientale TaxID=63057 RepID=A0A2P5FN81_TREOI|nr:hypothetical protein TorRG33x02_050860 [Trema orientale]